MFAGKISNPPSTPGVGVPGLRQLQWLQPRAPHRTASQHRTGPPASTMQDCQPWPRPRQHPRAVAGRSLPRDASCSPSTRARHAASLAICLSAEASEIPFNVNISSKAFHFLTYNTFPDFRDLLFIFPDTKSFPYPISLLFHSALKILVSLTQCGLLHRQKKVTIQFLFSPPHMVMFSWITRESFCFQNVPVSLWAVRAHVQNNKIFSPSLADINYKGCHYITNNVTWDY